MTCNILIGNRSTGKTYNAIQILNRYNTEVLYVSYTADDKILKMYGKNCWSITSYSTINIMKEYDFKPFKAILFDEANMALVRQMLEKFKNIDIFLMFTVPLYEDGERIV